MPKARQQYLADEITLDKELLTFQLDDELKQKIDSIDGRAEENVIEIVKVNSVPLPVDAEKAVDVSVPLVQDSLDSDDRYKALSARQGKVLYDYIVALQSRGRFLSSWDCENGTPVTAPFGTGYVYNPGDYYVVTNIAPSGGTNLRPEGTVYSGGQSVTPETENVDISDMYIFDGVQWLFQKNTARQIAIDSALSTTSTNPVENRVITNELNNKQNKLVPGDNITIDQVTNRISATGYSNLPAAEGGTDNTLVTTGDKYNWNHKQDELQAGTNIQINGNVISSTNTTYGNFPEAEGGTTDTLVTTGDKYNWNHKQDGLSVGNNITIVNNTISADNDAAIWGNITGTLSDQTDLQAALDAKQDVLDPGANIQINGNVISATDTTYAASDFDIKDLADSLNLRNTWNNKQDAIIDLNTIRLGASKGMTALQPGQVDNVSELINDAGYITKAVNDLTNYYNKNETYTKTEVDALLANFAGFEVVSVLPTTDIKTTVIYLLGPSANNTYEEYIYTNNQWVKIGETTVDLSNYFHKVNDDSDDIIEGSSHLFMTPAERTNLSHQSGYNTGDETKQSIETKLGPASATKNGYLTNADWVEFHNKQDALLPGTGIQINGDVISASFVAGNGININGNTITNTKPFDPGNGTTGQVLKKTASGYSWQDESGGGSCDNCVTSVNGDTGDIFINEFRPGSGTSGQILRKGSGSSYYWDDESGGGGGGGTTYYGGDYISIDSSHRINNDAPFVPGNGSVGQVLTKTSNGYGWATSSSEQDVRVWTTPLSQQDMQDICLWCMDAGEYNRSAIIKDATSGGNTFVFGRHSSTSGASNYYFWGTALKQNNTNGSYTTIYNQVYHITYSNGTYIGEKEDYQVAGNFLPVEGTGYNTPFMATEPRQAASRAYVDSAVAAGPSGVGGITNNRTGTSYTAQQIWVGTQTDYDNLQSKLNNVLYCIISS